MKQWNIIYQFFCCVCYDWIHCIRLINRIGFCVFRFFFLLPVSIIKFADFQLNFIIQFRILLNYIHIYGVHIYVLLAPRVRANDRPTPFIFHSIQICHFDSFFSPLILCLHHFTISHLLQLVVVVFFLCVLYFGFCVSRAFNHNFFFAFCLSRLKKITFLMVANMEQFIISKKITNNEITGKLRKNWCFVSDWMNWLG